MPDLELTPSATRSWKLPARAMPVAFAFFMSAIMAMLMCLVITAANRGIGDGYLQAVLSAYSLAMPVAFVCVMLVRPIVLKLVSLTVRMP
ncbi:uncharacterized protein DUF2798 [Ectopseudomonas oleovorans]|uniref:Uncharacterized protein DUF2798 n=2 Tax=Pseudomonadaceae TaxID=135621 RepID=A0A397MLU4_ECTOL|nr:MULTISPECIES: DUF2798 domain-containing protein [Pseudomonas]QMV65071.1 DUF2798 domain-containing protein [Pseudomonas berkeleyensis]RIA22534.1 uncharacterized protein DUF2798 [Pseudomonas oleovorans]WSO40541.1 DUF2798 domain-containing protein [Pseudomonas berkeleyensis]